MWRIFLAITLLFGASFCAEAKVTDWVNGAWGLDPELSESDFYDRRSCENNPIEIYTNSKDKYYRSNHALVGEVEGKILKNKKRYLIVQYVSEENEINENVDGKKWYMVFIDKDRFFWTSEAGYEAYKLGAYEPDIKIQRIRCSPPENA